MSVFYCNKCKEETISSVCQTCGEKTEKRYYCGQCGKNYETEDCPQHGKLLSFKAQELDIYKYFELAKKKLN